MVKKIFQDISKKSRIRKKTKWLCSWVFSPEFEEDINATSEDFIEEELGEIEESKHLAKENVQELSDSYIKELWEEFEKYYLPIAEEYKIKVLKKQEKKLKKFEKKISKISEKKSQKKS